MAMVSRRVRAVVGIIEASDGGKGDVVLDQLATLTALLSSSFQCWWWLICSCIGVKATTSCPSGGHVCAVWWTLLPCTFVHRWLVAASLSFPRRHCRPFRGIEYQRVGGGCPTKAAGRDFGARETCQGPSVRHPESTGLDALIMQAQWCEGRSVPPGASHISSTF